MKSNQRQIRSRVTEPNGNLSFSPFLHRIKMLWQLKLEISQVLQVNFWALFELFTIERSFAGFCIQSAVLPLKSMNLLLLIDYLCYMLYDDIIKLFTVSPKIAVKSSDKISESFVTFISDFEGSKESVREGSILYIGQRLRKYHQYHNLISPQLLVIHWGNEKPNFRLEVETWERNYQNRTGITLFEYRDYNSFLESFNFFISLKRIE